LQNLPPGGRQDDTIVSIVQRWAQTEPAQAADWVVQFPEGRLRDTAVQNLVQIWSEQANKPTEWLDSLEDGPVRDAGIATYARKLAPWSPEIALTWAAKISNPQSQAHEIEALAQHWFALDRKAAGAWIETAALPEELKKILLTPQ